MTEYPTLTALDTLRLEIAARVLAALHTSAMNELPSKLREEENGCWEGRHAYALAEADALIKESRRTAAQGDTKMDKRYVLVRTYSAGVFAGTLESQSDDGKRVVLSDARRIWYWAGAASLSQLAVDGTSKPAECKFPVAAPRVELTEAIEILDVTAKGRESIASVKPWTK